eukprot:4079268-Alexandrium_andersonii.AAC.1
MVLVRMRHCKPLLAVLSPPCTLRSPLNLSLNHWRISPTSGPRERRRLTDCWTWPWSGPAIGAAWALLRLRAPSHGYIVARGDSPEKA